MERQLPDAIYELLTPFGIELLQRILQNHFEFRFTELEKEILILILMDYSQAEISHILAISIGSVKSHARNIFDKLNGGGGSGGSGAGVPRKPLPSSDDFAEEAVREYTVSIAAITRLIDRA